MCLFFHVLTDSWFVLIFLWVVLKVSCESVVGSSCCLQRVDVGAAASCQCKWGTHGVFSPRRWLGDHASITVWDIYFPSLNFVFFRKSVQCLWISLDTQKRSLLFTLQFLLTCQIICWCFNSWVLRYEINHENVKVPDDWLPGVALGHGTSSGLRNCNFIILYRWNIS